MGKWFAQSCSAREGGRDGAGHVRLGAQSKGQAMELSFGRTAVSGMPLLDQLLSLQRACLLPLVPPKPPGALLGPFLELLAAESRMISLKEFAAK